MRTLAWRAIGSMFRTGCSLIEEIQPDLVFFTTTQFSLITLGPRWQRKYGVPFVVDLQDPWLTDSYSMPGAAPAPGGWKYRIAHLTAARLEEPTFRAASGFISVSPGYLESLSHRYPWFGEKPQTVIPFGVDASEYITAVSSSPAFAPDEQLLQFVSVGAVGLIMKKAVISLLSQFAQFKLDQPEIAAKIRLYFFGTSYVTGDQALESVQLIAREFGLEDHVYESTDRLTKDEVKATNLAADGLIIMTSDDLAYTPSKLAGSFLADRPALLVANRNSRAQKLSHELGLARLLDTDNSTPHALRDFVADIASPQNSWRKTRNHDLFAGAFTAEARTAQLAAFLDTTLLRQSA